MLERPDDLSKAELLLAGPRGRAVCWTISGLQPIDFLLPEETSEDNQLWIRTVPAAVGHERAVGAVLAALSGVTVDALKLDQTSVDAVADAVSSAMYWQPPDVSDQLLADTDVVDALRPIAQAIATSPSTSWWIEQLDLNDQYFVSWLWRRTQRRADPPLVTGAADRLADWRVGADADEVEAARSRPAAYEAAWGGAWWSTPVFAGLVTTTPALHDGVPAQLEFVEDPMGMDRARVARMQTETAVRVFEVTEPADLVDLVARYPLAMDRARRQDWFRATGSRGPWLIPDWAAIGGDYDAVHLTVLGYLATAGRTLPVGDSFTVLAGWEPSETWWLNYVLHAGEPHTWARTRQGQWKPR